MAVCPVMGWMPLLEEVFVSNSRIARMVNLVVKKVDKERARFRRDEHGRKGFHTENERD